MELQPKQFHNAVTLAKRERDFTQAPGGEFEGGGGCHVISENLELKHGWPQVGGFFSPVEGHHAGGVIAHFWNHLPDGAIVDATGHKDVKIVLPGDPLTERYHASQEGDPENGDPPMDWVHRIGADPTRRG